MSNLRKSESGAQLLGRLGTRPSLKGLEPALLGSESVQGDVVEFFGGDAVGKSELLLHLVALAVLPNTWKSRHLKGHKAEVIWVDTDLKFSVLRLAVIIEQRIITGLRSQSRVDVGVQDDGNGCVQTFAGENSGSCEAEHNHAEASAHVFPSQQVSTRDAHNGTKCHVNKEEKCDKSNLICIESARYNVETNSRCNILGGRKRTASQMNDNEKDYCGDLSSKCLHNISSESVMSGLCFDIKDSANKSEGAFPSFKECKFQHETKSIAGSCEETMVTEQELQLLVQQCLERVHIVRCTSSQQLLCTLHSLDATIAANSNISLLVVDPISAYFWSDKNRDLNHHSSYLHNVTCNVVNILKKFTKTYNLLVIVSKQALMKPKQKEVKGERYGTPCPTAAVPGLDNDFQVGFLGKPWSELTSKSFLCEKSEWSREHSTQQHYRLLGSQDYQKYFVIKESGVEFIE
ncbi:hypothetical protein C0Q70_18276 [Pomacea canaliculata]|uniref:RecA family profile 1 domain-containing protein n=1 Tax=Pomacea canaliculata TaxID=400727 RepID=A0A2T7NMS8_POMCA|nr:DNA repair protein XRCC2-like [Pomacea canaliculata]PVD22462.1 hypothetical protein C0Q70_18276 [Pomacea canaliculata]